MARHPLEWGMAAGAGVRPLARRSGRRLLVLVVAGLVLVVVGSIVGLTASRRGWLTVGLAMTVVVVLSVHHRGGGARLLARVVAEYVVVALLAVLLVTTGPGGATDAHHPPAGQSSRAGAAGEDRSVVAQVRDWLDQLKHRADQQAKRLHPPPPTTTTRPHRTHR